MPIEVKNFASQADEAKDMPNARMEAVNVLGQRVIKLTLAPDWKWSKDIKPLVGTHSCQATHTGIIVEGLPIRLTQTPPTCRVLPLSRVKFAEGRCPDVARDTKERAEGVERVEPPVEAECELVEVGL